MHQGAPPAPPVQITFEDGRKRIRVYIGDQATGPQVWQALRDMFQSRPELTAYDMLFDLRDYLGVVVADDVKHIVEVYQQVRVAEAEGTRTAFVTSDPNFDYWAVAMTYQFPGRLHRAFPNEPEAEAFLAVPKSERTEPAV